MVAGTSSTGLADGDRLMVHPRQEVPLLHGLSARTAATAPIPPTTSLPATWRQAAVHHDTRNPRCA